MGRAIEPHRERECTRKTSLSFLFVARAFEPVRLPRSRAQRVTDVTPAVSVRSAALASLGPLVASTGSKARATEDWRKTPLAFPSSLSRQSPRPLLASRPVARKAGLHGRSTCREGLLMRS